MPTETLHPDVQLEEGLIRPTKRRTDPDVGRDAALIITRGDLDYLLDVTRKKKLASFDMDIFKLHLVEKEGGGTFSIIGPFLGAPHAVMGMEKIIALGAGRVFALGWCGSLQPDLRIGDFVLPTDSLCEEGTSAHYPIGGNSPAPDRNLCRRMEILISNCNKSCRKGTVWTTDAPYRETPSKIKEFQEKGVLAVDMEMSALMTLATFRSVSFEALLVVSDELFNLRWRPGFRSSVFKDARRSAGELILELVNATDE
jgi:purine-nucleoside phosphorylase